MKTTRNMQRLGIAALAGALIASGCGSSATKAAVTTAAPTTTVAAATTVAAVTTAAAVTTTVAPTTTIAAKSPVTLALLADATGASAGAQIYSQKSTEAWAKYINAKGGINGHPVKIEFRDTKGDPAGAQVALDDLVAKKPIAIVLTAATSESAIAESLSKTGIPVIGVGYNPAVWGGYIEAFKLKCSTDAEAPVKCAIPNAFPLTTTFGAVVDEQVFGAQAAGAKKLATAACAEVDSCSQAAPVFGATAKALGLEDTGVTKISSSAPNYTAECIQWVQNGVDFIQISAQESVGEKMISDCAEQGYKGIWGASAGSVAGALLKVKVTLAGGLNAFPWWVDDKPVAEYRDAMKAGGATDAIESTNGTGLWSTLQLFAKANAKLGDSPTAAEAMDAMYTIKNETLDGLIAPVTFTKGELAANRACFWPFILKDGKLTNPLGGLKYQCNPAQ